MGIPAALALALFLAGPRVTVDDAVGRVEVGEDVEAWIRASEASVPDLRPGDGKRLEWADPVARARTTVALVYVHGFSADPHELDPVPARVADALGANLFATRLTGHGRDGAAMGEATARDWFRDAAEAVAVGRRLGRRVVLMGTSTGGALALWAAARQAPGQGVDALVLVSPNFHPRDRNVRLLLLPWGGLLGRVAVGPERCFAPANEAQARHWTTCYPTSALLPMMGVVERVRALDLAAVRAPALVLYSSLDRVVDPAETVRRAMLLGGTPTRLVEVETPGDPEGHVLAGDALSPATTDAVVDAVLAFLRPLLGAPASPGGGSAGG